MTKKRSVISYSNLSPELLEEFKNKYPYGYQNDVIKVDKPNGDSFYAVTFETADAIYLVKVNVKIDTKIKEEDEDKDFFGMSDDIGTDADSFDDIADDDDDDDDEVSKGSTEDDDDDDDEVII